MANPEYMNDNDTIVYAAADGGYELVRSLIDQGVDINIQDADGRTALIAAAGEYSGIVELLLSKGADFNKVDNDGDSALDIAKYHENKDSIRLLMEKGAVSKLGKSKKAERMDAYYDACRTADAVRNLADLIEKNKGNNQDNVKT